MLIKQLFKSVIPHNIPDNHVSWARRCTKCLKNKEHDKILRFIYNTYRFYRVWPCFDTSLKFSLSREKRLEQQV